MSQRMFFEQITAAELVQDDSVIFGDIETRSIRYIDVKDDVDVCVRFEHEGNVETTYRFEADQILLRVIDLSNDVCPWCRQLPQARNDSRIVKVNCVTVWCPIRNVVMTPQQWTKRGPR
ncbi:MAG: hypothetical protein V7638_3874 [Acidobacteriota bacterium]|jgi:hypothetical protein